MLVENSAFLMPFTHNFFSHVVKIKACLINIRGYNKAFMLIFMRWNTLYMIYNTFFAICNNKVTSIYHSCV